MIVDRSLCSVKLCALSTHLAMQDKTKVGSKNYRTIYRLYLSGLKRQKAVYNVQGATRWHGEGQEHPAVWCV